MFPVSGSVSSRGPVGPAELSQLDQWVQLLSQQQTRTSGRPPAGLWSRHEPGQSGSLPGGLDLLPDRDSRAGRSSGVFGRHRHKEFKVQHEVGANRGDTWTHLRTHLGTHVGTDTGQSARGAATENFLPGGVLLWNPETRVRSSWRFEPDVSTQS